MTATAQLNLFTAADRKRLGRQLLLVKGVMGDGEWRSLSRISALTGAPEASVSARLRDLRARGYLVESKRYAPDSGLWLYRMSGAAHV